MIACGGWEPTCAAHCASVSKELTCIQVARNETRLRAVEWRTWGLNGKYYDFWCCEDELRPRGSLEVKPSSLVVDCWWQWSRKELVQYQWEALLGNGGVVWARFLARQRSSFLWWSASWILPASRAIGELFRWSAGELSFNPKFLNFQLLFHPYGFGSDTCAALCSLARTFVILN